jgi:protein-S-isoprenylcysteine O-methyltransferase Ste14
MKTVVIRRYFQVFSTMFLQGAILFLAAGTVKWKWAWIFIAVGVVILIFNGIVLPREVIEERGSRKTNVKKWDKILTNLAIFPFLGMYIVAGLDFRLGWSGEVSGIIHVIGLIITYSGSLLFTWAMVSNIYFSTKVRIQDERSHQVATGGPYKYVRHRAM